MNDRIWSYRNSAWMDDADLVGYTVEARDGHIGKVDESSAEIGGAWLVVDTGFWIFGKRRLIPAGTISGIDHKDEIVIVDMTKDAIKAAPDYDSEEWDAAVQGRHTDHYARYVEEEDDDYRGPRPLT